MLISMPTGTSTIFGVFQAIVGLPTLLLMGNSSVLISVKANTEFGFPVTQSSSLGTTKL